MFDRTSSHSAVSYASAAVPGKNTAQTTTAAEVIIEGIDPKIIDSISIQIGGYESKLLPITDNFILMQSVNSIMSRHQCFHCWEPFHIE